MRRIHFARHDADDSEWRAVKIQDTSDDLRIAIEGAVPESIAQNNQRRRAGFVFIFGKGAAELRIEADDVEEIRGHISAGDAFRFAARDATQVARFERARDGEMLKRLRVVSPIEVIRQREGSVDAVGYFIQVNDPLRLRKGSGRKEHCVNDTEDGGIRADAEGEGEDRDDGETRLLQQDPCRVTQILKQGVHYGCAINA